MWVLEVLDEKNNLTILQTYKLKNESCIMIGRSVEGDIIFPTDRSISRKHAEIKIISNEIFIMDLKSTLGTFLNGTRIRPNELIPVRSGNILKFGNEHTTVRLLDVHYKFCPTRLEKPEKEKLKTIIGGIGADIAKQVESCTHVLCNRFSATVKTLTAIVLQKPIVSLHWVESFANASTNSFLIPDVKEFCPPGAAELTSVERLHLPRSHLLQDFVIFILFSNDSQYEIILDSCGALRIPMIGIDSVDELIKSSREKLSTLTETRTRPCVFYDEGRPLDTKTIHMMKRLNIPFLGSGDLATAIFSLSTPQLVTHEILSQKVSSQQSQIQISQAPESANPSSIQPQNGRSTTVVQTERVELANQAEVQERERQRMEELKIQQQKEQMEREQRKRELEEQAQREREQRRREQEIREREIRERESEELARRLELERIEKDRERKEKIEREKRRAHEERKKNEEEEEAAKSRKERIVTSSNVPNQTNETTTNSRVKRNAEVMLETACATLESTTTKKRRTTTPQEIPSTTSTSTTLVPAPVPPAVPPVSSSSAMENVFEDQPLINVDFNSQSQIQHQPSRTVMDSDGWVVVDKSHSGNNCIELTHGTVPPIVRKPHRTTINFDEPNSSLQSKQANTSLSTDYPQAVVILMDFQMNSNDKNSRSSSRQIQNTNPKDRRSFKKNLVRSLHNNMASNTATPTTSSTTNSSSFILKKRDMDKVLPKESEREMLLNQSYETEKRAVENREVLFSDGVVGNKTRKPRFGN